MKSTFKSAFERNVLKAVTIIGLLRAVIELSLDRIERDGYFDFYLDIIILIVFLIGMVLVLRNSDDRWLRWFFYLPLIFVLSYSMYLHRGLASSHEITVYAVLVIINLTMSRYNLMVYNVLLFVGVTISLIIAELHYPYAKNPIIGSDTLPFVFISVSIIALVNIAKTAFDLRRKALTEVNQDLITKRTELEDGNHRKALQNQLLLALKEELEEKVLERTNQLNKQNELIEEYLKLTLFELMKPHQKVLDAISSMASGKGEPVYDMVRKSGERLNEEIEKLRTRLEDEEDK